MLPGRIITDHFEFIDYSLLERDKSLLILEERNRPEIRKYMTDPHPISENEHLAFVESLDKRDNRKYFAVRPLNGDLIASQSLNPIDWDLSEGESGQFVFEAYQGKGYGKLMKYEFFKYLLDNNFLTDITERILIGNERNLQLDLKLGFEIFKKDKKYYYLRVNKNKLKSL